MVYSLLASRPASLLVGSDSSRAPIDGLKQEDYDRSGSLHSYSTTPSQVKLAWCPQTLKSIMALWMSRYAFLAEIKKLDPVRDHQRIVFLSTCYDFPFDTTRALEFALYRTFCVPRISALLDRTGEFQNRAQKRYDDTDLLG